MPELTCTKLVIYLDIQLFFDRKIAFLLTRYGFTGTTKRNLQCTLAKRIRQANKRNDTVPRADHAC